MVKLLFTKTRLVPIKFMKIFASLKNLFMCATMLRVRWKNYGKYGHHPSSFYKREENLMLRVKSFSRARGLMLIYVGNFLEK